MELTATFPRTRMMAALVTHGELVRQGRGYREAVGEAAARHSVNGEKLRAELDAQWTRTLRIGDASRYSARPSYASHLAWGIAS